MSDSFIMISCNVKRQANGLCFGSEPDKTRYLLVPEAETTPQPSHGIERPKWLESLQQAAVWGQDSRFPDRQRGDILVFVHGYNNTPQQVLHNHRLLERNLRSVGFLGVILSFTWPSAGCALNYMEDRHDAKKTAMQLVNDGIKILSAKQRPDCSINIHILAHSTGAYVVREAFDDADTSRLVNQAWMVSQVVFIAGDVSADSMALGNTRSDSLYDHCIRLTNYYNNYDSVLKLSNAKRLGNEPRVGRIGLPVDAPIKAVNVDCSSYYHTLINNDAMQHSDQMNGPCDRSGHGWYIGNMMFIKDLFETLKGDLDRTVIPTREMTSARCCILKRT